MIYQVKWNNFSSERHKDTKKNCAFATLRETMQHIIKSYLKFILHSKNEHGVHSPFVFDLVTKCFYASYFPTESSNYPSTNQLIIKTIHYLNLKECVRFDAQQELNTIVNGLIVSGDSLKNFSIEKTIPLCTNETCIFLENIHQTKENEIVWKKLHKDHRITVSIETFNLGLLFIRKEQKKEHFILKTKPSLFSLFTKKIRI